MTERLTPRQQIEKSGVVLSIAGERLLAHRRDGPLTETDRDFIRSHRTDLFKSLTEPWLDPSGYLIIPFFAPLKYQWWKDGGQSTKQTISELQEKDYVQQ
ncbi:MAG: hypothetical protein JXR80_03970 [Deltaproteobacteria bacterium]|nr:hypothetical protein [Deltaproteobacteria bacterium]